MPPIAIGAGIIGAAGIGGALIGKAGADKQAEAQQNIASAQQSEAGRQRQLALGAAKPTVDELEAMHSQVQSTSNAIARQEALLQATDPALIEAGQQALKLLRGQSSQTLAPIQAERDRQRALLVNNLQGQLGPGGVNSTAGSEALNRFDAETAQVMGSAQQSALQSLLGTTLSARPNPYGEAAAEQQNIANLGRLQERQVSAINQTNLTPYAGAPFVGAALQGQSQQNFGNSIGNLGGQIGTLGLLTGGFGSNNPTPQPKQLPQGNSAGQPTFDSGGLV